MCLVSKSIFEVTDLKVIRKGYYRTLSIKCILVGWKNSSKIQQTLPRHSVKWSFNRRVFHFRLLFSVIFYCMLYVFWLLVSKHCDVVLNMFCIQKMARCTHLEMVLTVSWGMVQWFWSCPYPRSLPPLNSRLRSHRVERAIQP